MVEIFNINPTTAGGGGGADSPTYGFLNKLKTA